MSKTKEKLTDAAIEYLNSNDSGKMSVNKLIKIANVGYGTFYNHFDSIEEIQIEALNKTIRNTLIDFKLDVAGEKNYVYVIYLALFRALELLAKSPSIDWLLRDPNLIISVFKEITQPNMENIFLNAVKNKQIKNSDIEDLLKFRNSRHYMQWAGIGAVQQIASNELSLGEAFEALSKTVNIVDIPHAERDQIIARILKEN